MTALKILHLSDGGINDPRIIRAANTGKNAGYEEYFVGVNENTGFTSDVFTKIKWIKFPDRARIAKNLHPIIDKFWNWYPYPKHINSLKKQIEEVVKELNPDIIHAHNIFVAHPTSKLKIPMIVDDHELYSVQIKAQIDINMSLKKRKVSKIKENLWSKWEQELGEKHSIITVSAKIAEHHKKYCKNVFVVPNYPSKNSIKSFEFQQATNENLCSVYFGKDNVLDSDSVRNVSGLHDVFTLNNECGTLARIGVSSKNTNNIQFYGYVESEKAYHVMQKSCHVGLLPWHKHWFHQYCSPNKVYEYALCGLLVMTINDLKPVTDDFKSYCDTFGDYTELQTLLKHYNDHPDELNEKRKQSLDFANRNLIWEKNEHMILDAYKLA